MVNLYRKIIDALDKTKDSLDKTEINVLITQWRASSGSMELPYSKRLIQSLEEMEDDLLKETIETVLLTGSPIYRNNQDESIFVEPFFHKERLILFGGGHIAIPLAEFGTRIGFSVVVFDDRPAFANKARFPYVSQVLCHGFDQICNVLKLTTNDYIVIITRGHRHDLLCLQQILKEKDTRYLGMIGSKRRVEGIKTRLSEEGFSKDRLEALCAPIGLPIGALTPEEISISILSEIIMRKRLGNRVQGQVKSTDLDLEVVTQISKVKESCCIVTVIEVKGSVPRGVGAKMIIFKTGQCIGSIGGGCSESEVIHQGLKLIGTNQYFIYRIDMTGDIAEMEGMVCGGTMTVLLESVEVFSE